MPVLSLLRDKETHRDKKLFTCNSYMILVVFQISMAGGVERKDERHLEECFTSVKIGPKSLPNHQNYTGTCCFSEAL